MVFGLSLPLFTQLHVLISLIGILAGVIFFGALLYGRWLGLWNGLFLVFTILTSATGFLFPPKPIGPPFIFGVLSLLALAVGLFALYARGGAGRWRATYLGLALFAQWLNMVVLVVQSFQKIPFLHTLSPTGGGPVFVATQGLAAVAVAYAAWATIIRPTAMRRA